MKPRFRILVVDDDPLLKQTLAMALEEVLQAQVWAAANGEQAVDLAQRHKPDLILLDLDMPGLDGTGVCRELAQHEDMAQAKVWIVTGLPLDPEKIRELSSHADRILRKPISLTLLVEEIEAQISPQGPSLQLLEE